MPSSFCHQVVRSW